jgi:hypothetical protein
MSRLILAALIAVLCAGASAAEQFYKWKDENGAWNYSSEPPKDKSSTTINIATGATGPTDTGAAANAPGEAPKPSAPGGVPPSSNAAPGDARTNRPVSEYSEARARAQEAQNANCERARQNVATLENNPKVKMNRDGAGERPLNDNEQMEELQKARRQVDVFCNPQ